MKTKSYKELRWIVRGLSVLFIAGFLIGENSAAPLINNAGTNNVILQLSIAGIGMIGLGLAWKWELIGGFIALVTFVVLVIIDPTILEAHLMYVWPLTAMLFILLWALCRNATAKNR